MNEYQDEELDSAFLELEIRSVAFRAKKAREAGNRIEARRWMREQLRLIALRSPEQVARLEAATKG